MKIMLGNNEYIRAEITDDGFMLLSVKARKDSGSYILVSSKLDVHDVDSIISFFVANKSKISRNI